VPFRLAGWQVMTLTFIWPITNGLLDALERIEASAQRVLRQQQLQPHHQQQRQQQARQSRVRRWVSGMQAWQREQKQWLQPLLALLAIRPGLQVVKQALFKDLPHALSSKQGKAGCALHFRNASMQVELLQWQTALMGVRAAAW
jgi:hypothetical protein